MMNPFSKFISHFKIHIEPNRLPQKIDPHLEDDPEWQRLHSFVHSTFRHLPETPIEEDEEDFEEYEEYE